MLNIALIVGSTRPNRFADKPKDWIVEGAKARTDFTLEVLDLRDFKLPFFEEPLPPAFAKGVFTNPAAKAWGARIATADGFIALTPEYHHAMSAVLKNAFESAYNEWMNKPIAFVGYGGVGAARAVENGRTVAIELQMAPIQRAVHIGLEPFLGVIREGRTLESYDHLNQARTALFDQLMWWAKALKAARAATGG
ncbi:MAG: NADPH-dependent oxidoreductase [Alphaproteobacteria bacterium]|nr:NADPH-dependent oxidoreductase [Alphaproteobacteria bacterium]